MKRDSVNYQAWMTVVYDTGLNIVEIINPQHRMLLQLNENDLIGQNINNLDKITDDSNKEAALIISKNVRKTSEEDGNVYFEYVTTHKDNTVTYTVCFAEKSPDGFIYVNAIKIDEDKVLEARTGFTNYVMDITINNISAGVYMRYFDKKGAKEYIQFNDVAKKIFCCDDVLKSKYWDQNDDDEADEKVMTMYEPLRMEKVFRDDNGQINHWLVFIKKKVDSITSGYYIVTTMIDITRRKHNEALLEKQLALLDAIYNNIPVGISLFDANGNVLFYNQKYMDILGLKSKHLTISKNFFDDPNIPVHIKEQIRTGVNTECELFYDFGKISCDYYETSKVGIKRLYLKFQIIFNEANEKECFLEICEDITEKYQQQFELKKVQNDLEIALSLGKMSSWIYDVKTEFFTVIAGTALNTDKISFKDYVDSLYPEYKENFIRQFDSIISKNIESGSLFFKLKKYGTGIPLFIQAFYHGVQTNGIVTHILGTSQNVTELGTAKENAEASNQLLNIIIEKIPGAIFIKDVDDDFHYSKINNKFRETLGLEESEIVGKSDMDLYREDLATKHHAYDLDLVEKGGTSNYESMLIFPNDQYVFWLISKSIISTMDGKRLIIGVATDVTDLHIINDELKIAQKKAEQSDKLKSVFLANMSHEIRTPLNAIVGFSDLLVETNDRDQQKEYCKIIQSNNEILLHLIGDILDLSKIEAGMIDYKKELIDISSWLEELAVFLRQRITRLDVTLIVDKPYKEYFIYADKKRITQVLTNFATNAIKFTFSGYIKIGYIVDDEGVKLYVEDSGIGIPEDKKVKLFERFEKLDTFAQGTGLGLSIAKAITEYNGGKVGFESQEGKGSTFWAWKPFSDLKTPSDTPYESVKKEIRLNKRNLNIIKKILVVEDNDDNFLLMKSILKGHEIFRAVNGKEAVEETLSGHYDIVFMDNSMPIMTGWEATRRIRKVDTKTPIIAVTANAFSSDSEEAIAAGCNAFLSKPVKKTDMLEIVSKFSKTE